MGAQLRHCGCRVSKHEKQGAGGKEEAERGGAGREVGRGERRAMK